MTDLQDAKFQEEILNQWRDWRAFLQARQDLLEARLAAEQATFEVSDTDEREQQARLQLQRIPSQQRTIFENELETRQREVQRDLDLKRRTSGQRGNTDPDDVERETLRLLRNECEGVSTDDKRGLVPKGDGEWYSLEIKDLLDTPAASYTIKGRVAPQQKLVIFVGIGGLLLALVLVFLLWPERAEPALISSDIPLVNGAVSVPWHSQTVQLHRGQEVISATVDVVPPATEWPIKQESQTALLWEAAIWPIELCVPGDLAGLTALTLLSDTVPDRHYSIREQREGADMVVFACGNPDQVRFAALRTVTPPVANRIGQIETWSDGTMLLLETLLTGPGHDPLLPANQARVSLIVATDIPAETVVDWPALSPTLILPDGSDILPEQIEERTERGSRQFRLTYLIPLPSGTQQLEWRVRDGGEMYRWRFSIPAPPTRDAVLHTLDVQNVIIKTGRGVQPGTAIITTSLIIVNPLSVPVLVQPADFSLTQGGKPVPLSNLEIFRAPLQAKTRERVEFTTTVNPGEATLTVGAVRIIITVSATAKGGET
jgi:hypothetical protein